MLTDTLYFGFTFSFVWGNIKNLLDIYQFAEYPYNTTSFS